MISKLQNIRPAQMNSLQHEKIFVNKAHQMELDQRQFEEIVKKSINKENEEIKKTAESEKEKEINPDAESNEEEMHQHEKDKEKIKKNRKLKKGTTGIYFDFDENGKEQKHVDIKI
jgi:hypothetical protein